MQVSVGYGCKLSIWCHSSAQDLEMESMEGIEGGVLDFTWTLLPIRVEDVLCLTCASLKASGVGMKM